MYYFKFKLANEPVFQILYYLVSYIIFILTFMRTYYLLDTEMATGSTTLELKIVL